MPFYHKELPAAINYGGIASVVGHELTHGFDDQGSKFDKDGNLKAWWSKEVSDAFQKKTQCIEKQYSDFSIQGPSGRVNLNGNLTLGENVADNGGVEAAFFAYKNHLANNNGVDQKLPGLGALELTSDQFFFLSFASIWCSASTPEAAEQRVLTDPHSPGEFRVTGTLRNSLEFAEAFSCPVGSPMNPADKCKVW